MHRWKFCADRRARHGRRHVADRTARRQRGPPAQMVARRARRLLRRRPRKTRRPPPRLRIQASPTIPPASSLQRRGLTDSSSPTHAPLVRNSSPRTPSKPKSNASANRSASTVTTPSQFKGGGYKDARRDFSELAVLFAVFAQYDGDVRWKDIAAGLRELFARAASNAKVGTDESYREATARKQDLAELVRGGRPASAEDRRRRHRLVASLRPRAAHATAQHRPRRNGSPSGSPTPPPSAAIEGDIAHEAQIVAMLADVIHREAFEYWDDETFVGFADELRKSATDISTAAGCRQLRAGPQRDQPGRPTPAPIATTATAADLGRQKFDAAVCHSRKCPHGEPSCHRPTNRLRTPPFGLRLELNLAGWLLWSRFVARPRRAGEPPRRRDGAQLRNK